MFMFNSIFKGCKNSINSFSISSRTRSSNILYRGCLVNNYSKYDYLHHLKSYCSTSTTINKENEIRRVIELLLNGTMYKKMKIRLKELQPIHDRSLVDITTIDQNDTGSLLKEYNHIRVQVDQIDQLPVQFKDYLELVKMAKTAGDREMMQEAQSTTEQLMSQCNELEFKSLMSNDMDNDSAYMEIHAGAGGTDSMDWTQMLSSMYIKWASRRGFDAQIIDESHGDICGYKKVILKISGPYAYGWTRTENGVHKLIRMSPFNTNGKRHTSFASVFVYPSSDADEKVAVDLVSRDLVIETMRSSGAGGQHTNKTESAVRITHTPSGLSVNISQERSQHKNKQIAMDLLKSKLLSLELRKRDEQEKNLRSEQMGINGFGSGSINRVYTQHPQTRIKDQRTGQESSNFEEFLQGGEELDQMIKEVLSIS
ncbi:class I peptide chain release factor [Cavenderia fasciculata]|uniref:Class I peptide chain release factor n=1 Tax=Cavenderia fasciculata TaxID=261658 RepID=B2XYI1_CACFS|nr:class I peptide chain release factor [Cavenderia fasciculata]ACA03160.1 RF2 [Cavenderia fasciculata]EGG16511.1 class I peptide chain release factor [Cavenderia fasciculata]|eukprot:XP_004354911.1 class I peptide chain release factor [Cavenderia fasciculata]